ncbi:MAG: Rhodanese-like domain protein [Bacteroidetes bacterium ADurb.Bin408]|nr:MAG: Rhodanese-like domain protein [Bacteroidetes bacterium ADurb.Bin408]
MKNNQLFNSTLIFFLFIIFALLFSAITHKVKGYSVANKEVLNTLQGPYTLSYYDFYLLYKDTANDFTIVDLRTPEAFSKENLKKSVNIPFEKLFDKESLSKLKDLKESKLLVGNHQNETSLAYLYLTSAGLTDIKVLPGSFDILYNNIVKATNPSYFFYNEEKAQWDFPRQMGGENAKSTGPAPALPQQVEMKTPVKGGC